MGCRTILGIEQKQFDPALADGGSEAGPPELSCPFYCNSVMTQCTGQFVQYPSMATCLGLCSAFKPGTLDDLSGDTLGCRVNQAMNLTELDDCANAGPGGNGVCGDSLCATLCNNASVVCPMDFPTVADCMTACSSLTSCPLPYSVGDGGIPSDTSVECRIYHLSAASADLPSDGGALTVSQEDHCPHVLGHEYCGADAGACTAGD